MILILGMSPFGEGFQLVLEEVSKVADTPAFLELIEELECLRVGFQGGGILWKGPHSVYGRFESHT